VALIVYLNFAVIESRRQVLLWGEWLDLGTNLMKEYYTSKEVCEIFSITDRTLFRWLNRDNNPFPQPCDFLGAGIRRWKVSEVEEFKCGGEWVPGSEVFPDRTEQELREIFEKNRVNRFDTKTPLVFVKRKK